MTSLFHEPTYAAAMVSDPAGAVFAALEETSHIPMLFAVIYALNAGHIRLGVTALASLLNSMMYHACRADIVCLGVPVNTWRMLDHISVLWVVGELILHLYMTSLVRTRHRPFFVAMGYLNFPVAAVAVLVFPYSLLSGIIVVLFLAIVGAVRLVLLACSGDLCPCNALRKAPPPPNVEDANRARVRERLLEETQRGPTSEQLTLGYGITTLCCISLGFIFYCLGDDAPAGNSTIDATAHILWHIFSGFALFCGSATVSYSEEAAVRRHAQRRYELARTP